MGKCVEIDRPVLDIRASALFPCAVMCVIRQGEFVLCSVSPLRWRQRHLARTTAATGLLMPSRLRGQSKDRTPPAATWRASSIRAVLREHGRRRSQLHPGQAGSGRRQQSNRRGRMLPLRGQGCATNSEPGGGPWLHLRCARPAARPPNGRQIAGLEWLVRLPEKAVRCKIMPATMRA
jgi:hypothetical protein